MRPDGRSASVWSKYHVAFVEPRYPRSGCDSSARHVGFINLGRRVKNGQDRLVVLNRGPEQCSVVSAGSIQATCSPTKEMPCSACWPGRGSSHAPGRACRRVHNLKHTFGRRLRAAGVRFEDRQDLLGHRSHRITTHYSAADLTRLIEAAESVCERDGKRPELMVLRTPLRRGPAKSPTTEKSRSQRNRPTLRIVGSGGPLQPFPIDRRLFRCGFHRHG
jgi:hypothetical protein